MNRLCGKPKYLIFCYLQYEAVTKLLIRISSYRVKYDIANHIRYLYFRWPTLSFDTHLHLKLKVSEEL